MTLARIETAPATPMEGWTKTWTKTVPEIQLSASQLELYKSCPRKYAFKYVFRLDEIPSKAQLFGTRFSSVAERWLKGEDPFPAGWDEGLWPVDADLQRALLRKATEGPNPMLVRRDPQVMEEHFLLDALPEELALHDFVESCGWNGPGCSCPVCTGQVQRCRRCRQDSTGELDPRGCPALVLPQVRYQGFPDVWNAEGIEDHKTTKSIADWSKKPDELRQNMQLLIYGRAWLEDRRRAGLPDPEVVRLRHLNYEKNIDCPRVEAREATPPLTPAEIDAAWEEIREKSKALRLARVLWVARDDDHAHSLWPEIPGAGTVSDAKARRRGTACGDYGGCPFGDICGGGELVKEYRERITKQLEQAERSLRGLVDQERREENVTMSSGSLFGARFAATGTAVANGAAGGGVATAPPPPQAPPSFAPPAPAQAAPPPPPTAPAPPQAPPPQAYAPPPPAAVGQSAPPPAQNAPPPAGATAPAGPPVYVVWDGAPPWARKECGACVETDAAGAKRPTGITYRKGDACRICTSRSRSDGGLSADFYDVSFIGGEVLWEPKRDKIEEIEKRGLKATGGSCRLPWMAGLANPGAAPPPSAPAAPAASAPPPPAAPAPAPSAPPPPAAAPAASAPPPPAAPAPAPSAPPPPAAPAPGAPAAGAAPGPQAPKKVKFFLLLDCVPRGGVNGVVRLDAVFHKYAALLAAHESAESVAKGGQPIESYWELPPFRRCEKLAFGAAQIAESEKFHGKYVVASTALYDVKMFAEAMAGIAEEVILGVKQS